MQGLFQAGWRGVSLERWGGGDKEFVLAFDDGYQCVEEHALKTTAEFGFTATVFIPTGYIGRNNDWDHQVYGLKFRHLDVAGLKRLNEAGWEIGSHTVRHCSLRDLEFERVSRELSESKQKLEDIVGREVVSVSYPFGRFDQTTLETSARAGYKWGIAPGLVSMKSLTSNGFTLFGAEAVYLWDGFINLEGRLTRQGRFYQLGSGFRKFVNKFASGTVIYQRLASKDYKDLP